MTNEHKQDRELETSPDGSTIYQYKDCANTGLRPPEVCGLYAADVEKHFKKLFPGRECIVFREIESDLIHIDVHVMLPTRKQPFYVLYTTGMSDLPMTLSPDIAQEYKHLERAELFIMLLADWDPGDGSNPQLPYTQYWPIHMLKCLARFPHEYDIWLGWGHSMPNGPNYEPLVEGCNMGGFVLLEPDENPGLLKTADGTPLHLYMVVPVYREEIEYKLEHGMHALEELFAQNNLPQVLDLHRPNYCQNQKI